MKTAVKYFKEEDGESTEQAVQISDDQKQDDNDIKIKATTDEKAEVDNHRKRFFLTFT